MSERVIYSESGAVKGCFDLLCVVRALTSLVVVVVLSYYEGRERTNERTGNREGTAMRIKNPCEAEVFLGWVDSIGGSVSTLRKGAGSRRSIQACPGPVP